MANAKISALTTAAALDGTEVLPVVQSSTTKKVAAADVLRQTGQSSATSNPVLNLAQTWTQVGVTYTGWKLNITDTNSAAGSLLVDLQVGGSSKASIDKAGILALASGISASGNGYVLKGASGVSILWNSGVYGWASSASVSQTSSNDTGLSRSAAAVVAVGNGTAGDTSGTLAAKNLRSVGSTVANLTAAATAGAGARAWVTDATQTFASANFGTTVTGGGANGVPVVSDGSNWKIG